MSTTLIAPHETSKHTASERWTMDSARSTVEFEVEHIWGLHTVHGCFRRSEGEYVVGPDGAAIELAIDAASVDTGVAMRDEHLRSADFLYVALHPRVRFTSTGVTPLPSGDVHVTGELEAAGTSVPLAFDASVSHLDGELELETTTTVDQRRFGMAEGPLGNVRPPTTVHVRARLVRDETQ